MRRVVIESPYAASPKYSVEDNVAYAKEAIKDCLSLGEAPIASHLLFTQPGILDDKNPSERKQGIEAGHAWIDAADAVVFYCDHGISDGMIQAIKYATTNTETVIEFRFIKENSNKEA